MKIAFVVTGLGMGGAEKVVTSLADAMAKRKHELLIVYMTGAAVVLPVDKNIRVVGLGIKSPWHIIFAFLKLRRVLLDFKPDIVHSHMVHANIFSRLLRLTISIPRLISTAHSSNEGGGLRMLAYRATDFLADISTNVSYDAVNSFVRKKAVKHGRMIAIHNGVSILAFSFDAAARQGIRQSFGILNDCKLILAVGRLCEPKDYPNLLMAFAKIDPEKFNYKLVVAGDGPLKDELKILASNLGVATRIQFLGVRQDIPSLMSAADVFVLSSAWEGFGLVVAEAMACERVVVATDCGGVKEVVGKAGYLVSPRSPDALAEALQTALELAPDECIALGKKARKRVQDYYSLDAAVEKWLRLYIEPLS